MNILLIGINHKTAPIEVREKFYLNETQQALFLSELKSHPAVVEAVVLSTCNRTEICLHVISDASTNEYLRILCRIKKISFDKTLNRHFYAFKDREALKHLLRVTAGLDSLVIGEKQILGQVKAAFDRASEYGLFAKPFNIFSNIAIQTGKKAHRDTLISHGGSSVSWAAITTAEKMFESFEDVTVLILGAGKMSEMAVEQISKKGFKDIYLMNRTHEHAIAVAQKYGGQAVPFVDIKEVLPVIDLCICATDAPHYILEYETVRSVQGERQGKPTVFIDISMPRNIDPKISLIKRIALFYIDDLQKAIAENMKTRMSAMTEVESIIEEKLNQFYVKMNKMPESDQLVAEPV